MYEIIPIPGTGVISSTEFLKRETTIESNSYLIKTPNMNILIDAGSKEIFKVLKEQGISHIDAILLTHGHADHIKYLQKILESYKCNVFIHENDQILLKDSYLNGSELVHNNKITAEGCNSVPITDDDETLRFDNLSFQVIHTPGHTHGSVMYYCEQLHALFTGDMILGNTIGSTHVPTGNKDERKQSIKKIKEFLDKLPENTVIYPGHGPEITLKELKAINEKIWPKSKKESGF